MLAVVGPLVLATSVGVPLTPSFSPPGGGGSGGASSARNLACGASEKPRVAGVPASVSTGGGAGLPERAREGRGRGGVSDLGGRAIARNMARAAKRDKPTRTPRPVLRRTRVRKGPISSNGE